MGRNDNLSDREKKALANENSGSKGRRAAAIAARGAKATIRKGGTGRSQRQLGHVRDK